MQLDNSQLREKSIQLMQKEDLRYQSIELPGGIITPGTDRSYLLPYLFGSDFSNKTYLDVGSYLGYFCLEASKRGAAKSLGIETDHSNTRQAEKIATLLKLEPEYLNANFETWNPQGQKFDVVSCLNVLHHLFDPIHALRNIMDITLDRFVLEVATPSWHEVIRGQVGLLQFLGIGSPKIYLGKPKKRGFSAGRTYLFSTAALRTIINVHSNMFNPIEIVKSSFKGRTIVIATKRKLHHIVVVAGPTSSGKSTFCGKLMKDPVLRSKLAMAGNNWRLLHATEVEQEKLGRDSDLIFHYDILRPSRNGMRSFDRDVTLDLLSVADKVTVVTIRTPRERLAAQLKKGEIDRPGRKPRERDIKLLADYEKGDFIADWYGAWNRFVSTLQGAAKFGFHNDGDLGAVRKE